MADGDVFVHPQGLCESDQVGAGTRVWAFAHVLPGARVGAECNICDNVFVEGKGIVGDRVTIKCGVQIWDGVELEDDVFVGPNATFTNDPMPRSRRWLEEYPRTVVRAGASIGANATILPGLEIGQGAMIGAGAVVTRTVPPHAIVVGNPARIIGYTESPGTEPPAPKSDPAPTSPADPPVTLGVDGVHVTRFKEVVDLRGSLAAAEMPDAAIPFNPRRWFMVYNVPSREIRGEHAHHVCEQFLICVSGRVTVAVDDGRNRGQVVLDRPTMGIYVPPLVWASEYRYEDDAVLLVLASHPYEPDDYIRQYDEFLKAVARR